VPHPVLNQLLRAFDGEFPAVDGLVEMTPALGAGLDAVVSFTGHAVLATAQTDFTDLGLDGFGRALGPAVLQRLAGPFGRVGVIDATLVAGGTGGVGRLPPRTDLDDHPRVAHARLLRDHVRVFGDERGLVTISRGLAGRSELSVEVGVGGQGLGRSLIRSALDLVPVGQPIFAAVAPGNARSLRAFLAAGFVPIASEVIVQTGAHVFAPTPTVGARLMLEPLRVDHAEEMTAVLADPSVHAFIGGEPATTAGLRRRYRAQAVGRSTDGSQRWLNWIVRRRDNGHAVGYVQATVSIVDAKTSAELAWVIGPAAQGQGFGTEAASTMVSWLRERDVGEFVAHVHPGHRASNAVAARIGLSPTAEMVDGEVRWHNGAHRSL
jgi:RimJ/RimL family protein N-acetyltransferase